MDRKTAISDRRAFTTAIYGIRTGPEQAAAPDYDLWTEARDGYLHAMLRTATMVPEVYRQAFAEVRTALHDKQTRGLMLEYDTPLPLTEEKACELVSELAKIMPEIRIALVAQHEMHLRSLDLGDTSALETGPQISFFAKPAAAEAWLRAG